MKIIDIGICVNNIDPKGIGRIRFRPYGTFVSEMENTVDYNEWDEFDPFIALPFLPLHLNVIPQVQQSVKLIEWDTEKEFQNIEYISGPYTSPHDTQNQTFATQHKDTTYGGVIIKGIRDIRNKDGTFNAPTSRGAIINERDTGFRGNYGSDLIFTENGVQLRGGLLLSKQGKNKQSLLDYPQMAKKMGRFSLKKFPSTFRSVPETVETKEATSSKLKYVVEYEIDNLSTPTELKLFVYKVIAEQASLYGKKYDTNVFGENSTFDPTATEIYLINTGETINYNPILTIPTYTKILDGTIQSAYIELRELLYQIDNGNLTALYYAYPNEDIHPFYFRPSSAFRLLRGTTETEIANKATFISKVQLRNRSNGAGLIFSRQSVNPPIITTKKETINAKEVSGSGEQSFSNLSADKIYLTSTSPNVGVNVKAVNFNDLDEYELTQEDYIAHIEPNTYAMVRGENLYNVLIAIKNLLDTHIHNINKPLVQTDDNWIKLNDLIETLRNDLLNDSIRIN